MRVAKETISTYWANTCRRLLGPAISPSCSPFAPTGHLNTVAYVQMPIFVTFFSYSFSSILIVIHFRKTFFLGIGALLIATAECEPTQTRQSSFPGLNSHFWDTKKGVVYVITRYDLRTRDGPGEEIRHRFENRRFRFGRLLFPTCCLQNPVRTK